MNLAEHRRLRLFALSVLYVAQGIPWGFMATTLPAYLTDRGLDFGFVTATLSFTTLPYAFKWIWGPVVDTVTLPGLGRRRGWILVAQTLMAVTIFVLVAVPDLTTDLKLLAWMILIHTVFNSLQDVAVDALAVDLLDDDERGRANGMMYGSKYLGGAIGGIGMASMIRWLGLDAALIAQACTLLAIMVIPIALREPARAAAEVEAPRSLARDLAQAFSLRSTLLAALLMLGANFAVGVVGATGFQLFVGELGWDYFEYTGITGGWVLVLGGVMAGSVGFLVDRFGRRRIAAIAAGALAAGWVAFALLEPYWREPWLVYAGALWGEACISVIQVALLALCMDLSWPRVGGSQFAAYMALSNFSTTLGYQFAARATALWEFHGIYLLAAAWQLVVIALLPLIDRTEARRVLPLPPGRLNWLGLAALLALLAFLVVMTGYVTLQKLA